MSSVHLDTLLTGHVFAFLLIFTRVGCVLMLFPGIGEAYVSARTRMLLALSVSFLLTEPLLHLLPPQPAATVDLAKLIAAEAFIGLFFGTIVSLLINALDTAGSIVALQTGLSNATILNPSQAAQSPLPSALLGMAGTTLIFVTGFDRFLFQSIKQLYVIFPPGGSLQIGDAIQMVTQTINRSFTVGIELAIPFLVMGLLMYVAVGILQKLLPQIQLFLIVLPIQIWGGLGLLALCTAGIMTIWLRYCDASLGAFLSL